jgi:hypothetical protein
MEEKTQTMSHKTILAAYLKLKHSIEHMKHLDLIIADQLSQLFTKLILLKC